MNDPFFVPLDIPSAISIPSQFHLMEGTKPHPVSVLAAKHLQSYLTTQTDFEHNFGLDTKTSGTIIGKMFGVLAVKSQGQTGYLAAFSGKLAGTNHHKRFVPPVFDSLAEHSFLNAGMRELNRINAIIKEQGDLEPDTAAGSGLSGLKEQRKAMSASLQQQLFNSYTFLNQSGAERSLNEIFHAASYRNPPSGAGECAGPKLLQYAFSHAMQPLALTEFWWGLSPKSATWKHGHYYPCCREKCGPILGHMLS